MSKIITKQDVSGALYFYKQAVKALEDTLKALTYKQLSILKEHFNNI